MNQTGSMLLFSNNPLRETASAVLPRMQERFISGWESDLFQLIKKFRRIFQRSEMETDCWTGSWSAVVMLKSRKVIKLDLNDAGVDCLGKCVILKGFYGIVEKVLVFSRLQRYFMSIFRSVFEKMWTGSKMNDWTAFWWMTIFCKASKKMWTGSKLCNLRAFSLIFMQFLEVNLIRFE